MLRFCILPKLFAFSYFVSVLITFNVMCVLFQGGSYIFEFDSYADLHVCRDFVSKSHLFNQRFQLPLIFVLIVEGFVSARGLVCFRY